MKTTHPPIQFMTNPEVSALMNVSEATTRSRLYRISKGKSSPDLPQPRGKIAGAWVWDRAEVNRFVENKGLS